MPRTALLLVLAAAMPVTCTPRDYAAKFAGSPYLFHCEKVGTPCTEDALNRLMQVPTGEPARIP